MRRRGRRRGYDDGRRLSRGFGGRLSFWLGCRLGRGFGCRLGAGCFVGSDLLLRGAAGVRLLGSDDRALHLLPELVAVRVLPRRWPPCRFDGRERRLEALVLEAQRARGDVQVLAAAQQRRPVFGLGARDFDIPRWLGVWHVDL